MKKCKSYQEKHSLEYQLNIQEATHQNKNKTYNHHHFWKFQFCQPIIIINNYIYSKLVVVQKINT